VIFILMFVHDSDKIFRDALKLQARFLKQVTEISRRVKIRLSDNWLIYISFIEKALKFGGY